MGVLSCWCRVSAKFSAPRSGETASNPKKFSRCKNLLEALYHHAKFDGAGISPVAGAAKNGEFFVSVRHAYVNAVGVRQVAPVVLCAKFHPHRYNG